MALGAPARRDWLVIGGCLVVAVVAAVLVQSLSLVLLTTTPEVLRSPLYPWIASVLFLIWPVAALAALLLTGRVGAAVVVAVVAGVLQMFVVVVSSVVSDSVGMDVRSLATGLAGAVAFVLADLVVLVAKRVSLLVGAIAGLAVGLSDLVLQLVGYALHGVLFRGLDLLFVLPSLAVPLVLLVAAGALFGQLGGRVRPASRAAHAPAHPVA